MPTGKAPMNVQPISSPTAASRVSNCRRALRRALPRVRAGGNVSLRARPALHAGRRAEGDAARAARSSRHRARRDRAGELPWHRQRRDARLHRVRSEALSRRRHRRRQLHRQGLRRAASPAACAACASISSSISAARPTWPCSTASSTASRAAAGTSCCISTRPTSCRSSDMMRKLPLPFVIDHMGRVPAAAGVDQPPLRALLELRKLENCWIKVCGAERISMPPYAAGGADRACAGRGGARSRAVGHRFSASQRDARGRRGRSRRPGAAIRAATRWRNSACWWTIRPGFMVSAQ